jgi:hypothetical protein
MRGKINTIWVRLGFAAVAASLSIGCLLIAPIASAACNNTAGYGSVTFTGDNLNLHSTGTYYIWTRLDVPTAGASYQVEINGGACFLVSAPTANQWVWTGDNGSSRASYNFATTTGNTIKLIGANADVKIDMLLLTTDPNCVPVGIGSNCGLPISPTTSTNDEGAIINTGIGSGVGLNAPPSSGVQVSGKVNPSPTLATTSINDILRVEYYVDGKKVQTADQAAPLDTTLLSNGRHHVETKITFRDGSTKTDEADIDVNNKQTMLSPVWRWMRFNEKPLVTSGGTFAAIIIFGGGYLALRKLYLRKRLLHFHGF